MLQWTSNIELLEEIKILASGPDQFARRFKRYIINGFRFLIKESERSRTTQNSGIVLKVDTMSYASAQDRNPHSRNITFHGVLTDIIELWYTNYIKFVLFKCDWIDNQVRKKQDEFKFTMVILNHLLYKDNYLGDEPFILATQAEQVCYVQNPLDPN